MTNGFMLRDSFRPGLKLGSFVMKLFVMFDSSQRDRGVPSGFQSLPVTVTDLESFAVGVLHPACLEELGVAPKCPGATSLLRDEEVSGGTQALLEMLIILA
ncbi:hypothetical protein llap_16229 [Limosa lapponica baueri]|uniref:Uncharacterized protein n=1 Tax=Limosa lapponica baueri TaxID=1758121 RepID=A0A2I0TI14_LIMLA|nr:hypothetical protein llap_16229 [Limosa lapponica baueri]